MLQSLRVVGSTILSRTLVGEQPREISTGSLSFLVSREELGLVSGSVLSNERSSFTLPSSKELFGNDTEFVDSQVTEEELSISEGGNWWVICHKLMLRG